MVWQLAQPTGVAHVEHIPLLLTRLMGLNIIKGLDLGSLTRADGVEMIGLVMYRKLRTGRSRETKISQ